MPIWVPNLAILARLKLPMRGEGDGRGRNLLGGPDLGVGGREGRRWGIIILLLGRDSYLLRRL